MEESTVKIVTGLGSIDDYVRFVKAGADEFFCGYVPYEWTKKYGIMLPLNRREVLYCNVQIGSLEELRILKRMVDLYHVPVKITFNSLFYLREQYPLIIKMMKDCIEVGFDTFIIGDVALLHYVRENQLKCKIHLSGELGELNHLTMEEMNNLFVKRYIFHRKNTIKDMKECIARNGNQGFEYEAFALNEWCHYTGGFCNSLHCDELPHLCKVPYELKKQREQKGKFDAILNRFDQEESFDEIEEESNYCTGATGCGLCAIKQLKAANITHLKVVGRGNYADYMEQDIKRLKQVLELEEKIEDEAIFKEEMKRMIFPNGCSHVCYYREE